MYEQYWPTLRSKDTLKAIKQCVGVLEELGVRSTADLNIRLINRIVGPTPATLSPNSVRSLLRNVSAICTHAVDLGYLASSPFKRRPIRTWVRGTKPKTRATSRRRRSVGYLTLCVDVREKRGYAQVAGPCSQTPFTLVAYTGLRKSEALFLHVEDVDLAAGVLHLVDRKAHRLKTECSEQPLPIVKPLADCLKSLARIALTRTPKPRRESPWLFPNALKPTP